MDAYIVWQVVLLEEHREVDGGVVLLQELCNSLKTR